VNSGIRHRSDCRGAREVNVVTVTVIFTVIARLSVI